jgi:hypothetical protein
VPPTEDLSREELVAMLALRDATIAGLVASNAELRGLVADLERRLGRNSGNSSMPPSSDDRPGVNRATRRAGKVSERKRGKQPGAPGSGLSWTAEPDTMVAHVPAGACDCGRPLADATDLGVGRSHQVHDVALVNATVTQHDLHRAQCDCGQIHQALRPEGMSASATSYGPNLQALVVYLLTFQHLPVERAALLIADLTGAQPSVGFVHGMLARAGDQLEDVDALIRAQIAASPVVGFDETTLRVGPAGVKQHVLAANTDTHTALWLGGRGLDSFHAFGVLDAFTGIAVHDRYSLYDHPSFGEFAGHQLCVAHLARDLADAAECWPTHHWPAQAAHALRGLIRCAHQARARGEPTVTGPDADAHHHLFQQAVLVGLSQIPPTPGGRNVKQLPARALLECLRDREHDVLRFTTDTRVPPTNNGSERTVRPEKTQQKISGRLTSEAHTRHRLRLRSYLATAAKHHIGMLDALRQALTGNPWLPPDPAPA